MRYLLLILCLSAAAAGAAPPARASATGPRLVTTAPLTLQHGVPVVDALVNGKAARFVLDTGAYPAYVTSAAAARLGLTAEPGEILGKHSVDGQPIKLATVDRLQIGAITLKNFKLCVADGPVFTGVDGVIGCELFNFTASLFDFPDSRVTIWSAGRLSATERSAAGMAGAAKAPLTHPWAASYDTVAARFGYLAPTACVLDTGSSSSYISTAMARQLHLHPYAEDLWLQIGGDKLSSVAALSPIVVGGSRLADQQLEYPRSGEPDGPSLLGVSAFRGCRILVDMPGGALYIKRVKEPATEPPPHSWTVSSAPLRIVSGVPLLGVTLADNKIHWFGLALDDLDNSIAPAAARRLGLQPGSPSGGASTPDVVGSLQLGGQLFTRERFTVVDPRTISSVGSDMDGLLGARFLAEIGLRISPSRSTAQVIRPHGTTFMPPPPAGWQPIALRPDAGGGYNVSVHLDGRVVRVTPALDQGISIIDDRALAPKADHPLISRDLNWSGAAHLRLERLHSLEIGSDTWPDPVIVRYIPSGAGEPGASSRLDCGVWDRYDMLIEPALHVIYLHRNPAQRPDPYPRWDGSGILSMRIAGSQLRVGEVVNPSPASEAGVQPGDIITAVNGEDAARLSDDALAKLLQNPHGPEVTVRLQRAGTAGPITVSMIPTELLAAPPAPSRAK